MPDPVEIGNTVLLEVPDVDRSKSNSCNIMAVVMEVAAYQITVQNYPHLQNAKRCYAKFLI